LTLPNRWRSGWPGADVMITIFGDFSQFLAKKLAFFLNANVMINFFQNLALFWVKNANFFANIFGENIFKIITSVPDLGKFSAIERLLLWRYFYKNYQTSAYFWGYFFKGTYKSCIGWK
jgi:hypothetical protein